MPAVEDYLTKQIYIEKNVVTFRSLSRQFGLHVNAAKNELAKFHSNAVNSETRSFATYLLSGEIFPNAHAKKPAPTQTDDGMDVDSEIAITGNDGANEEEEVPVTTLTLVGEHDIEHAKSKYARIFSTHVYCLSPSPLADAGFICDPSAVVYKADAVNAPTSSVALGRVVGPDVKIGKVALSVASSSRVSEPLSRKPTVKVKVEEPSSAKTEKANTVKPKPSGKLDWSKAKKSTDGEKSKEKETKAKKEERESPIPKAKTAKTPVKSEDEDSPTGGTKRGVKRKAAPPPASDAEDKPKPSTSDVKLKKNRIVSDSEDEEPEAPRVQPKAKAKIRASAVATALESAAEKSLREMMDIDDSQVEKASASRPPPKPQPAAVEDEDVEMASEPGTQPQAEPDEEMEEEAPKPKPRKRKEKKVVPVGRNGIKKRRVVKTRMTTDAKGYMVAEDYSEYESVDDEEAEEEQKKPKGKKGSAAAAAKAKKGSDDEGTPKSKPIARTGSLRGKKAGGQGNLQDFFGRPKK